MPSERPDVTVLLVQRLGPPDDRQVTAWEEALAAYDGTASVSYVWAGAGAAPARIELGTLGAAVPVLGIDGDAIVVVADASATPGPHLLERLVEQALAGADRVVDARVLPVELTLTDDRMRGYHLPEGTDPDAAVLEEERHPGDPEGAGDEDDDEDDEDDGSEDGDRATAPSPAPERSPSEHADESASAHEVLAGDGQPVRPRITGACVALRARHLAALGDVLAAEPSATSGAALVSAARARDLEVDVAVTAAVALPVHLDWDARVVGRVPAALGRAADWPATTHPAALPASSLGQLTARFGLPLPHAEAHPVPGPDDPFLTIVTRTQGRRLHCLEDMFTCLAAQTDRDFEVLVMAHRVDPQHLDAVRDVVASLPAWLREQVRVVPVERAGRAAPLNDGFEAARGHYVVALDDDDTVLAHYVATFRRAAEEGYGRLVRVVAARQDIAPVGSLDTACAVSVDDAFREWPMDFAMVAHLSNNYSPFMSVAFPRGAFHDLGMRFDEELNTTEDWDYIVRCATVLGVTSVREITCVYRWWVHTGSSREVHTKDEWDQTRLRVQARFEESVLLIQPIETRRMVEALSSTQRAAHKAHRLAREMATTNHHTNLRMIETEKARSAAARKQEVAERRVDKLRTDLQAAKQRAREQTARVRRLRARVQVEERLRLGRMATPSVPLDQLTTKQLEELLAAPPRRRGWRSLLGQR